MVNEYSPMNDFKKLSSLLMYNDTNIGFLIYFELSKPVRMAKGSACT